jgi:hypothetical protein
VDVPRERFLPPAPWLLSRWLKGYQQPPDADPVYLYQDVSVAIDPSHYLNIGQTSFLIGLIARGRPQLGETVVHVGTGTGYYTVGVVHKSSTLILQLWARLVDARTGRDVFSRNLNFRGDTDEAWQRAETFLAAQIRDASTGWAATKDPFSITHLHSAHWRLHTPRRHRAHHNPDERRRFLEAAGQTGLERRAFCHLGQPDPTGGVAGRGGEHCFHTPIED